MNRERLNKLVSLELQYRTVLEECQRDAAREFRAFREHAGWTQRDLAAELGVDFSYISKIENGHMQPGIELFYRFHELLAYIDTLPIVETRS